MGMNLLYGLTHAPANVLVLLLLITRLDVHWVELLPERASI